MRPASLLRAASWSAFAGSPCCDAGVMRCRYARGFGAAFRFGECRRRPAPVRTRATALRVGDHGGGPIGAGRGGVVT
jgi:hypothetical protein